MGRIHLCAMVCVAACARGTGAGGGAGGEASTSFSIVYPDAPPTGVTAKLGKRFYAKPEGRCLYDNGREARWTMGGANVASGELPPGLLLEDGQIGGVPTQAGTYRFQIGFSNVTCAGKPYEGQAVDVQITVK